MSVFEQKNFTDDKKITKRFSHPTDNEDVKLLTDILHHSGTNPDERKRIETEQEAWRTVNAMFEEKEKELKKVIDDQAKLIEEPKRKLGDK